MKFIHTFWSKPLLNNKHNTFSASLRYLLSNYAFSAHCVQAMGHEIVLYTDKYGTELFSFITYNNIIILDDLEDDNMHFFARYKFEALKKCDLGDVIIDGDIFLYKPDVYKKIEEPYDVIYSFKETAEYNFNVFSIVQIGGLLGKLSDYSDKFKPKYKLPQTIAQSTTFNTSVLKINNEDLRQEYIEQYEYHYNLLKDIQFKNCEWPDLIIEQYFLRCLCEHNNSYFAKPIINNLLDTNESDINGFIHVGGRKYELQDWVESLLKNENIELYNKYVNQYYIYTNNK